jgi:hypothetical protein
MDKTKNTMKNRILVIISLTILLASIYIVSGCQNEQVVPGTLEGTVSIGPIWPVERPGEKQPVSPQVFETRKVVISNESKSKVIKEVDLIQIGQSARASYSIQLKPGKYIVDINRGGIDNSSEVPKKIEIQSGQIVIVDIDIDTGIR